MIDVLNVLLHESAKEFNIDIVNNLELRDFVKYLQGMSYAEGYKAGFDAAYKTVKEDIKKIKGILA
jgi:hypothetical protein